MYEIETINGPVTVLDDKALLIRDANTFLEVIYSAGNDTIVFETCNFPERFFDLKTGLAGDILQKVSNYRVRIIILGDFENVTSKSLKDFIYESNKFGKVIFSNDMENAINLLK